MIRVAHVTDRVARRSKRFLVERTWPRHVDRESLQLDGWFKEAAPTFDLQRWFGGRLERWMEFREEYLEQLEDRSELLRKLREAAEEGDITLIHAARDHDLNFAMVLKEFLDRLS